MALLRSQLGTNSKKEMEEMLKQGYTMQQILEHFMKNGKTEEEEQQERGGSDFAKKFKVMSSSFNSWVKNYNLLFMGLQFCNNLQFIGLQLQ